MKLRINGAEHVLDIDPQMPLLWAVRDHAGLTGTKFGCGIGQCGACTVHVDGRAQRSCVHLPVKLDLDDGRMESHHHCPQ